MTIASLLMAGLMAFVLLVPTLMVAVLLSGLPRRGTLSDTFNELVDEPAELHLAA